MKVLRHVLESLAVHACRSLPSECCGILLASPDDPSIIISTMTAENVAQEHSNAEYVLDHKAHIRAVQMEVTGTVRIAGYYHSHPGGEAKPSAQDVGKAISGINYLIIGLRSSAVEYAVWRLENAGPVREPLEVSEQVHEVQTA